MKLLRISVICSVAIALSSCYTNDDFIAPEVDSSLPIQLYNEIVQVPTTRVNDEGFCDGDAVGIYVVNFENGASGTLKVEDNQADNVKFVYDETNFQWVPENPIYFLDARTHVDIIGYYPYANPSSVTAYPFELQKDQSTVATNGALGGYEASDFLWGKAADITPTASRINLKFYHQMAGVQISLVEGTGWDDGEWAQIEKSALVTNTKRKSTIDLATGEVTAIGDVPTTGTVPYVSGDNFRAVVVPQSVSAGVAMFSLTVDGIPYVYRYRDGNGTAIDFEYLSGKLHKFDIEVSKKPQSGGVEFKVLGNSITAWETDNTSHDATAREYVIINVPEANPNESALKLAIAEAGKDYAKIKNLKVAGKINAHDFNFMRDEMAVLQSINLKNVKIVDSRVLSDFFHDDYQSDVIPNGAFRGKSSLIRFVFPNNITEIGTNAFSDTNLAGTLQIPEGVVSIGYRAFARTSLNGELLLPNTLKMIEGEAFKDCSQMIGELSIPENVVEISDGAFSMCSGFAGSLKLPDELQALGGAVFEFCSGLNGSLVIPSSITKVHDNTFQGCGFDGNLILSDKLIEVGSRAFARCKFRGQLNLPDKLTIIGNEAFIQNYFSGKLVLPEELAVLGSYAFEGCKMSGVIEIPQNITTISEGVFSNCSQLEGVVFHSAIDNIGSRAFAGCFYLNSITSKATTPPVVGASAFDGVAKDNFAIEVPESSVIQYSTTPIWNEFKRFAAHRDFSISRNLFRTLNASDSKTLVLRAEADAEWTVEAPEWITVTPSSGVGKKEVTIAVNEMTASEVGTFNVQSYSANGNIVETSYNGRSGKVVFHLTGKDYTSTTTVEQYDYRDGSNYKGDGYVITNQSAELGDGVNIVFMGDCFDAQDIASGKYLNGVNEAINHFFAVEPYKSYKKYFNIYTVIGLSPDSGVGSVNTIREARFGSQYGLQAAGSVGVDENICFEYACKAPTVTEQNINKTPIVLVENTTDYDGITYMWGDGSAIALCPMSDDVYPYDYRGIVQHEAGGHAFGKLGDEYIYVNDFVSSCRSNEHEHVEEFNRMKSFGFYDNLSLTGNMHNVPWSHMIFDPQFSGTVDIYEGGFFHTRGVFRSEQTSCMNNNVPYFSAISRESIVKRIMAYAGLEYSYNTFKANDIPLATDEVEVMATTRSKSGVPYASRSQFAPVFMGEKPNFKKSNK